MNVAVSVGLVLAAILGACLLVLWYGSAAVIDKHEDRLTDLENRWAETFGGPEPAADDSPAAEEVLHPGPMAGSPCTGTDRLAPPGAIESYPDDAKTDEIPVAPATVPDGMPLVVQSALIEQRPSPVPREPEMIERVVNIGGTLQTFRIPAREDT